MMKQLKELSVITNDFRTNQKRFAFAVSTQLFCEGFSSRVVEWRNSVCAFTFLPPILLQSPSFSGWLRLEGQFQLQTPNAVFSARSLQLSVRQDLGICI